jgi:amidohydrolase
MGTLITGLPGVLSRRIDPRHSTVMVWGAANAGVAANAIPQTGTLAGTVRTASRDTWVAMESLVRDTVSGLLAPIGIEHTLQYHRGVPPVVNEERSTQIMTHAIEAVGPDTLADTHQSGGGEDFSWYLEEVPGAMGRLGVWSGQGPQLDLHQPTFDLDERALAVGVRVLVNIVEHETSGFRRCRLRRQCVRQGAVGAGARGGGRRRSVDRQCRRGARRGSVRRGRHGRRRAEAAGRRIV